MAIEPIYNTINLSLSAGEVLDQIKLECKTEIPSSEVSSVLNVSAFTIVTDTEKLDGKVKYNGKIIFYACYLDLDGEIKKCECGSEFSGTLPSEKIDANSQVEVLTTVEKVESQTSGIKLSFTAILQVKAKISQKKEVLALTDGEELILDKKEQPLTKGFGVKESAYFIEDEFELGYTVEQVLSHRATAVITSVQCGVGSIIVDGQVFLSVIALQKTEKKDIIRENKTLPFRMEIEYEDAMPSMLATAFVKEKSFKTDISVDQEKGVSTVSASVNLIFWGEAYSNDYITIVDDAFCTQKEISLVKEDLSFDKALDLVNCSNKISGKANLLELPNGASILALGSEKAEVVSVDGDNGVLKITGVLTAVGYFKDGDGKCFTRKLETPFEALTDCPTNSGCSYEVLAVAENGSAQISSNTEIELETELFFTIYPKQKSSIRCIKEVVTVGEKQCKDCAISVYLALEGEDLWSLSKRLNQSPEMLVATNKDLNFPLTGKERIIVYRQK